MSSPQSEKPPITFSSPTSPQKGRREPGSSGEAWSVQPIECYLADEDPYVVAYPGVSLATDRQYPIHKDDPLVRTPGSRTIVETYLKEIGMVYREFDFVAMQKWHSDKMQPCVRILVVEERDPRPWRGVAEGTYNTLSKHGFSHCQVVISLYNRRDRTVSRAIVGVDDIVMNYRQIRDDIFEEVRNELGRQWTTISLCKRGYFQEDTNEETRVLVGVKYGTEHDWAILKARLEEKTRAHGLPGIPVEFDIERIYEAGGSSLRDLPPTPFSGASIGVAGDRDSSGTLGGFIKISLGTGNTKRNMLSALTCHHVVSTSKTAVNPDEKIYIQYPSHSDLVATKEEALELKEIYESKRQKCQEEIDKGIDSRSNRDGVKNWTNKAKIPADKLEKCDQFIDGDNRIGRVVASSGKHLRNGRKMDWAVIDLGPLPLEEEEIYINMSPEEGVVSVLDQKNVFHAYDQKSITEFGNCMVGSLVLKRGCSTHTSLGRISEEPALVQWDDPLLPESMEYQVHPLAQKVLYSFAEPGDSGAFVVDLDGRLIAMVIGVAKQNSYVGIVSAMDTILESIKESFGGDVQISLPRVSRTDDEGEEMSAS